MNFQEWADALAKRGSDEDIIFVNGKETTPRNFSYEHDALDKVAGVKIWFYGRTAKRTKLKLMHGTCLTMLKERRTWP